MVDILSQEEIDLLLGSVSTGELKEALEGKKEEEKGVKVSVYDFRRPERISKEQLKGLQSIFEAFARELTIVLPPYFRTVVRVDLISIDQITYDEFILAISRPTCLVVINLAPLEGAGVLELSPSAVFPMIDRLLGGKGKTISEYRELTEIEERIVTRVVDMMLSSLKRAWEQIIELNAKVDTIESDPLIVQIVAGSEMVILVSYEIHLGENKGTMNFCIPFMTLTPLLDQISRMSHYAHRVSPDIAIKTKVAILKLLLNAPMRMDVILGRTKVRVNEIMNMEKGDVLVLNQRVDEPVIVEIEGHPKLKSFLGRRGEEIAIRVSKIIREEKTPEKYL